MRNTLKTLMMSCAILALAGCAGGSGDLFGSVPGAGGSSGGGSGGGSGGSGGGSSGGGGGGGGSGVQLRGLAMKFEKAVQVSTPGGDIHEVQSGDYWSDDPLVTRTSSSGITASLEVANPQAMDGNATLTTNGNFLNGNAVGDTAGESGTVITNSDGDLQGEYIAAGSNPGDKVRVVSRDVDSDGTDDFFAVDQHNGGANVMDAEETVGIYYGGNFAPESALSGKTTATYSRSAGSQDAGFFRVSKGAGLANVDPSTYKGDVTINADFTTGKVNGSITNTQLFAGTNDDDIDIKLENADIDGVHYSGGTVRIVDEGTDNDAATLSSSAFIGSFMGDNAESTSGVFQGAGTMDSSRMMISGRFSADEE